MTRTRPRYPGIALVALLVLDLSFSINAMDRQVFPVLLPAIRADQGFSAAQSGLLSTVFALGLGLAALPAGYAVDRFRRRTVLLAGIAVFSVGTVLCAYASGFADMTVYRVLSGAGEGIHLAALMAVAGSYFHRHRGLALGSVNFCYGLGAFLGPTVGSAIFVASGDWRLVLVLFGVVGLLLAAAVPWVAPAWVTEDPGRSPASADEAATGSPGRRSRRDGIAVVVVAVCVGWGGFSYLGLYPTYLVTALHYSQQEVGLVAGLGFVGSMTGLAAGWSADRISMRVLAAVGLAGFAVVGTSLFVLDTSPPVSALLAVVTGTLLSGVMVTVLNLLFQRALPARAVGRASGLFALSFYTPGAFAGLAFGTLAPALGWGPAAGLQIAAPCVVALVAVCVPGRATVRPEVPAAGAGLPQAVPGGARLAGESR